MSINKNVKNADFREVIIQDDESGKSKLLQDLINDSSSDSKAKIIASMFLLAKSLASDSSSFLVLKPKCLWLSIIGGKLTDAHGYESEKIAAFQPYKSGEIIKASFLLDTETVYNLLQNRGITVTPPSNGVEKEFINGLSKIFMYDINELNRTRSASISTTGNAALNSIWL